MSEQNAHYKTLGLNEASSFEEVQSARKRLVKEYEDDPKKRENVEAAYDSILMERLRLRQEGKIKVPDRIRFAEKQAIPPASVGKGQSLPSGGSPQWLQDFLDQPEREDILWPSITFSGLALASWFVASSDPTSASAMLGFGVMASVYFLNRKERKFWRAILLSAAALAVGLVIGFVLVQILASQGTSLPAGQAAAIASVIAFIVLWFVTCFLR